MRTTSLHRLVLPLLACLVVACSGEIESAAPPEPPASHTELAAVASACVAATTARGETKLCASCECGSCSAATSACVASGNAARDAACGALATCQHQNACVGDACYCGTGLATVTCFLVPLGPCVAQIDAATGTHGLFAIQAARAKPELAYARAEALATCGQAQCPVACASPTTACTLDALACQDRVCSLDAAQEQRRATSAAQPLVAPVIDAIAVDGVTVWHAGDSTRPALRPGQTVTLTGRHFGAGTDVDFAKIMLGDTRVLETDLKMYEQKLDIAKQVNYETQTVHSSWDKDVRAWSDTQITFRVPVQASAGPLVVQVQKRLPANESLLRPGEPHLVPDAQTLRIRDGAFVPRCDVVSGLGAAVGSQPVAVDVQNGGFAALVKHGREIFWSYDFNIGAAHAFRELDWKPILAGTATDPMTHQTADPRVLFGAYPTVRGEVPDEAIDDVYFAPYPQPNPIPGFLGVGAQLLEGWTRGTGRVGYRLAQSVQPFKGQGEWVGFNCASCHGVRVSYQKAPGQTVTKVIPGLPNPEWSMKWSLLGTFKGIVADEDGPRWAPGKAAIDKTALIYSMPQGTGEHTIVRGAGEGSHTDNDYQFSPIAIPNVTHYLPIRRSLSHTESYVGFEGSYIHSEEPDGAMGSMNAPDLQALTAYMSTLSQDDDDLRRVGLYRTLVDTGRLVDEVGTGVSEGDFVQRGWDAFPVLRAHIDRGRQTFLDRCGSCHEDVLGAHTTERMVRLDEVGHFFAPTVYQREQQSIRATFLRDLYWTQHRGLLSDGHVRNLTDLVDPDRCTEGTALYDAYYTLHAPSDPGPAGPDFPVPYPAATRRGDVFRVPRSVSSAADDTGAKRNRFIERHRYFVTVPWDPNFYYWDYQKLRREYGPAELGTAAPIGMPAAPHPWCAGRQEDVEDLVQYLLTL
jgi:mono/diheme cytochrome c family protein